MVWWLPSQRTCMETKKKTKYFCAFEVFQFLFAFGSTGVSSQVMKT
jgi:hypothetical protein